MVHYTLMISDAVRSRDGVKIFKCKYKPEVCTWIGRAPLYPPIHPNPTHTVPVSSCHVST